MVDEGREGRSEDSLRLVRGTEAVRLEGRSKRERREKERGGQNFLSDIPRFLGSCTSEGGRWQRPWLFLKKNCLLVCGHVHDLMGIWVLSTGLRPKEEKKKCKFDFLLMTSHLQPLNPLKLITIYSGGRSAVFAAYLTAEKEPVSPGTVTNQGVWKMFYLSVVCCSSLFFVFSQTPVTAWIAAWSVFSGLQITFDF